MLVGCRTGSTPKPFWEHYCIWQTNWERKDWQKFARIGSCDITNSERAKISFTWKKC